MRAEEERELGVRFKVRIKRCRILCMCKKATLITYNFVCPKYQQAWQLPIASQNHIAII